MEIALSDKYIRAWLKNLNINCKIVTYKYFKNARLEDLEFPMIINYLNRPNFGHWTCLFINKYGLNFFDSYGLMPDDELKWKIDLNFRREENEDYGYLSKLLHKYVCIGGIVNYNDYKLQSSRPGVNTCGRHVLTRIYFGNLSCDEYIDLIKSNPDKFVTEFTS